MMSGSQLMGQTGLKQSIQQAGQQEKVIPQLSSITKYG
jgi:hypothetical protein